MKPVNFAREVELLLEKVEDLQNYVEDPVQLKKSLLDSCYSMLALLDKIPVMDQDITTEKLAKIAADQHARELSALHTATVALLKTIELDKLLGQILDAATSAIPASEKGMIYLIAQETGQLEMRATLGYTDPRIKKFSQQGNDGYIARAVRERQALLVGNLRELSKRTYAEKIPEVRAIQSAIVAPLILNEQVLGALSLESATKSAFKESDLKLLASFAATATAAIHNAQLHAKVQKLAITDALTSLYNRRGFFELGRREVDRAIRFERPLTAILLDIDHFKEVNDGYGHAVGDRVLRRVAELCKDNTRKVDILGRYGGDEFVVLLPETNTFTASNVAERLRSCIEENETAIEGGVISVTISLGVASATRDILDLEALLSRADAAMYAAKQSGRNRVEVG